MAATPSSVEEAFAAIEEGNAYEKQGQDWNATQAFHQAFLKLSELAHSQHPQPPTGVSNDEGEQVNPEPDGSEHTPGPEQEKIQKLYREKALEYFFHARTSMIQALRVESEKDRTQTQTQNNNDDTKGEVKYMAKATMPIDCTCHSLKDTEIQERFLLFAHLFGREEDVATLEQTLNGMNLNTNEEDAIPVAQQEASLEERLAALNKSLPPNLKSTEEQMQDINQGLRRLGVSVHSNMYNRRKLAMDMPPKSETEQVEDIIAQAKDEVDLLNQQNPLTGSSEGNNSGVAATPAETTRSYLDDVLLDDAGDSDLSDKEESQDNDDDDDDEFTSHDLAAIREKVNEAQSSLAQLNALLTAAITEEDEDEEENDVKFDKASAKKSLRDARVQLQQATHQWRELSC